MKKKYDNNINNLNTQSNQSSQNFLNEIKLVTRKQLASAWNISESRLDLISQEELPRIRIGKSVRFTLETIQEYIRNKNI